MQNLGSRAFLLVGRTERRHGKEPGNRLGSGFLFAENAGFTHGVGLHVPTRTIPCNLGPSSSPF